MALSLLNKTMENLSQNNLESEIADLSRQIEEKKRVLEASRGIEREDKALISETVAENFYPDTPPVQAPSQSTSVSTTQSTPTDYLTALEPETIEKINAYITLLGKDGIKKTIAQVMQDEPFIIDAFHDALVTRLYDELRERGLIKA